MNVESRPGVQGASRPTGVVDLFARIRAAIAAGNYTGAVTSLIAQLTHSKISGQPQEFYEFFIKLFEHFKKEDLKKIEDGLKMLLSHMTPDRQINLLQEYVNRRDALFDLTDSDKLLDHYYDLMFFGAEAIAIATSEEEKRKAHHFASQLILKFIKRLYIGSHFFRDTLLSLTHGHLEKPFIAFLEKVNRLQEFCCDASDETTLIDELVTVLEQVTGGQSGQFKNLHEPTFDAMLAARYSFALPEKLKTTTYYECLQYLRATVTSFDRPASVEETRKYQHKVFLLLKDFFKVLVDDALEILGPIPHDYEFDLRVMGSVGKEEATSYSDFEIFILYGEREPVKKAFAEKKQKLRENCDNDLKVLEEKVKRKKEQGDEQGIKKLDEAIEKRKQELAKSLENIDKVVGQQRAEVKKYLNRLVKMIKILIVSLGETKQASFLEERSKTRKGISLDAGGVLKALIVDNCGVYIQTPDEMARVQATLTDDCSEEELCLRSSFLQSSSLFASSETSPLYQHYQNALYELRTLKPGWSKVLAARLVLMRRAQYAQEWQNFPSYPTGGEFQVDIKQSFIQLVNYFIGDIALYLGVDSSGSNTLDLIDPVLERCRQVANFEGSEEPKKTNSQILKSAVAELYNIRARLHGEVHREQNNEAHNDKLKSDLTSDECQDLKRSFWLVIYPIYRVMESDSDIEEFISTLCRDGLHVIALREALRDSRFKTARDFNRLTFVICCTLVDNRMPYAAHEALFKMLCEDKKFDQCRDLYFEFFCIVCRNPRLIRDGSRNETKMYLQEIFSKLSLLRDRSGYRWFSARQVNLMLEEISSTKEQKNDGVEVKVSSAHETRYLTADAIDMLLERNGEGSEGYTGKLKHPVVTVQGWRFEQALPHLFIEEAVHTLTSRIGGYLTPITTRVALDVKVSGKEFSHAVAITNSIDGRSLDSFSDRPEELVSKLNRTQWTWMILSLFFIRPRDDQFSNYIIDDQWNIYRIQNQASFMPLVNGATLQFLSPLFCLDIHLDRTTLEEFCGLDMKALLTGWIEDLKKSKSELKIPESAFSTLSLQFFRLRAYLNSLKDEEKSRLFPRDLLSQLVDHRGNVMSYVVTKRIQAAYETALSQPKIQSRLNTVKTGFALSMTSSELDFLESEGRKAGIEEMQEALKETYIEEHFNIAFSPNVCVTIDYQKWAKGFSSSGPWMGSLTLLNSHALQIETTLASFSMLECLTIDNSPGFNLEALSKLARLCPQLKELVIARCPRLDMGKRHSITPIKLPLALKKIVIDDCPNFNWLWLVAPSLETIGVFRCNPTLDLMLEARELPKWEALDEGSSISVEYRRTTDRAEDLQALAELRNPRAQFQLGKLRATTKSLFGVSINFNNDLQSIEKAAERYAPAQFFLAVFRFVEQNQITPLILQLLLKAEEQRHFAARRLLEIYLFQKGLQKNFSYDFNESEEFSAKQEISDALHDLQDIQASSKKIPFLELLEAELLYILGDIRRSLQIFLKVFREDKSKPSFSELRCRELLPLVLKDGIHNHVSDPSKYLAEEMEKLAAKKELTDDESLRRGRIYAIVGDVSKALADLKNVVSHSPEQELAHAYCGDIYREQSDTKSAFKHLNESIARHPTAVAYLSRGELHRKEGCYDLALADFTKAIACDKSQGLAWAKRAEICLLLCYFERARKDIERALLMNQVNGFARLLLHMYETMTKHQKTHKAFLHNIWKMEASDAHESALRAHFNLTRHGQIKKHRDLAFEYLRASLKFKPKYPFAIARRGEYHRFNQNDEDAIADFDEVIAREPLNAFALGRRGWSKEKKDKLAAAVDYRRSLAFDPDDSAILRKMGDIAVDNRKHDLSLQFYERAMENDPTDDYAAEIQRTKEKSPQKPLAPQEPPEVSPVPVAATPIAAESAKLKETAVDPVQPSSGDRPSSGDAVAKGETAPTVENDRTSSEREGEEREADFADTTLKGKVQGEETESISTEQEVPVKEEAAEVKQTERDPPQPKSEYLYSPRSSMSVGEISIAQLPRWMPNGGNSCYISSTLWGLFFTVDRHVKEKIRAWQLTGEDHSMAEPLRNARRAFIEIYQALSSDEKTGITAESVNAFRSAIQRAFPGAGLSSFDQEDAFDFLTLMMDSFLTLDVCSARAPKFCKRHHFRRVDDNPLISPDEYAYDEALKPIISDEPVPLITIQLDGNGEGVQSMKDLVVSQKIRIDARHASKKPSQVEGPAIFPFKAQFSEQLGVNSNEGAPELFIGRLGRFSLDHVKRKDSKLFNEVYPDPTLEFPVFSSPGQTVSYDLVAIIVHKGDTIHRGHYYIYFRLEQAGTWKYIKYDDIHGNEEYDAQHVIDDTLSNGYIYFYKKRNGGTPAPQSLPSEMAFDSISSPPVPDSAATMKTETAKAKTPEVDPGQTIMADLPSSRDVMHKGDHFEKEKVPSMQQGAVSKQFRGVQIQGTFRYQQQEYGILQTHQEGGATVLHALLGDIVDGEIRFKGDVKMAYALALKAAIESNRDNVQEFLSKNLSNKYEQAVRILLLNEGKESGEHHILTRLFGGKQLEQLQSCHQGEVNYTREIEEIEREGGVILLKYLATLIDRCKVEGKYEELMDVFLKDEPAEHASDVKLKESITANPGKLFLFLQHSPQLYYEILLEEDLGGMTLLDEGREKKIAEKKQLRDDFIVSILDSYYACIQQCDYPLDDDEIEMAAQLFNKSYLVFHELELDEGGYGVKDDDEEHKLLHPETILMICGREPPRQYHRVCRFTE